jgi:hypothetical protein
MNTQDRRTERNLLCGDAVPFLICAGLAVNGFPRPRAWSSRPDSFLQRFSLMACSADSAAIDFG